MDNIRFVLIVTFGMLVFMLWQAWQQDYGPKPQIAVVEETTAVNNKEDLPTADAPEAQAQTDVKTAEQTPLAKPSVKAAEARVVTVKTDTLALEIDLEGGTIRTLDLLEYPEEKSNTVVDKLRAMLGFSIEEPNLSPVRLLNGDQDKIFVAQSGLISGSGSAPAPDHHSLFSAQQEHYSLEPGQDTLTVTLTWTGNNGLAITKSYLFKRGSYEITLDQKISNNTGQPWTGRQYSQLLKKEVKGNQGGMLSGGMRAFDGGVIYTEKEKYQKISFDDMVEENLDVKTNGGWTAFIQHYFATAWIPPADKENHFYTKSLSDDRFVIGSYSPAATVAPNDEGRFVSSLFSGPKIQPAMEKVAPGLELTVDYSVLTFIGKPIYWLLNKIHSYVNNWGIAIIGVTLCIKLLMFPLTQASFKSMAKMRKIQPRLKELQERFADDRQRLNQEMMTLYRKEQVNPLGGCLPLLLQIPVFMCLYWVLSETVEFRQAPFMLWIQDLSVQDPFYVLPLIMGLTMKIQQNLNPTPVDPVQAKVIKMFPIVFTIFFLFFPAGLVLYWVVNNTLSIFQQMYIAKKIEQHA
ncbi:MAG: membrane protein insertase YidC [Gammaproteobacteria bacterium]